MARPKKKNPIGRPTKYRKEYAQMAKVVIEDSGLSIVKLAKLFNVDRNTIYKWFQDVPEFLSTVETARDFYDGIKIHKSLVKRAVGFAYNETTREAGEDGELRTMKKVRKYFPPDVSAIKHWQVNRHPEKWRDRQETAVLFDEPLVDIVRKLRNEKK
ncbi:MAG: helix-turn-helix domain-containing protein [Firmicutes bacterium]|nr:helix-turn-helix domain-containing protein [Bacillota bacterium]